VINNYNTSSYEQWRQALCNGDEKSLATHKEHIQQSNVRYTLVKYLTETFPWQYWMVVTFGFKPSKEEVEDTMYASHYFFDRWLLTNNKLNHINGDKRSRWILLPELGSGGHLHFNCFLDLKIRPEVKTYKSEWHAVDATFKNIFKKLKKGLSKGSINHQITERKYLINDLRQAIYSTKEMRYGFINQGMQDHFANLILSWKDWVVKPINRR
jgi:hypothetical protein